MRIIAEVPDEAIPQAAGLLRWLAERRTSSAGELLIICAGEDSRDCPIKVRLLDLRVAP